MDGVEGDVPDGDGYEFDPLFEDDKRREKTIGTTCRRFGCYLDCLIGFKIIYIIFRFSK